MSFNHMKSCLNHVNAGRLTMKSRIHWWNWLVHIYGVVLYGQCTVMLHLCDTPTVHHTVMLVGNVTLRPIASDYCFFPLGNRTLKSCPD